MALITCVECGKEYSDKAPTCINCGYPTPQTDSIPVQTNTTDVTMLYSTFATIFIIAMLPTYLLRGAYLYNSFQNIHDTSLINSQGNVMNLLMVLCYIVMAGVTYKRASSLNKSFITVFPILSGIFDIILIFIPFVSTVLNVITLILILPKGTETLVKKSPPENEKLNKLKNFTPTNEWLTYDKREDKKDKQP